MQKYTVDCIAQDCQHQLFQQVPQNDIFMFKWQNPLSAIVIMTEGGKKKSSKKQAGVDEWREKAWTQLFPNLNPVFITVIKTTKLL